MQETDYDNKSISRLKSQFLNSLRNKSDVKGESGRENGGDEYWMTRGRETKKKVIPGDIMSLTRAKVHWTCQVDTNLPIVKNVIFHERESVSVGGKLFEYLNL